MCGMTYDAFRTGLTFREVWQMLWVNSEDSSEWKYKRRHTVLGLWHQIKKQMWAEHLEYCKVCKETEDEVPF